MTSLTTHNCAGPALYALSYDPSLADSKTIFVLKP